MNPTLEYEHPSELQRRPVPWLSLGVAVVLTAAGFFPALYEAVVEPTYRLNKPADIMVLRVLPYAIIVGWVTWALLVSSRVRPRVLAISLVVIGAGPAWWSCSIALHAHRNYESDQATAANWQKLMAEDAATRASTP